MEIETKIKLFENLIWIISTTLAIVAIVIISLNGWLAGIALLGIVLVVMAIILDRDIIFPAFIIIVTSTAQIPEQYHHIISYGFTFILLGYWMLWRNQSNTSLSNLDRSVFYFMLAIVLLSLLSAIFSEYYRQSLFATARQAVFFFIVYIIYDWMRSEVQIQKVFYALVFIGLVISIPAIFQFAQSGFSLFSSSDNRPVRYAGFFTGVSAMGMNLSYILPIAFAMTLHLRNGFFRILLFFSVLMITGALFLTFARAAWLSAALSTTVLLFTFKRGKQIVLMLFFLSVSIILFSETVQDMLIVLIRLESGLTQRDILWKAAWEIFKDHPFLGTGPWTYKEYVFSYTRVEPGSWISGVVIFAKGGAHNFYLHSLAEFGISGFFMATGVFVLYFHKYRSAFRASLRSDLRYFLYPCGAIIVGAFGGSFFHGAGIITSGWLSVDLYFWVIFVVTLRIGEIGRSHSISSEYSKEKNG